MAVNEYINAPANDEYFVRFSNGYGRQIYFNSFSKFLYKTDSKTFGGGYRFQNNNSAFLLIIITKNLWKIFLQKMQMVKFF